MQPQKIFPRQHIYSRKVVDLLMQVHAVQCVGLNLSVGPPDVPVTGALFVLDDPAQLLGDLWHDGVLGVAYVEDDFFVL